VASFACNKLALRDFTHLGVVKVALIWLANPEVSEKKISAK